MATAAQAQATPTTTDPVERWLARRGACTQLDAEKIGSPASFGTLAVRYRAAASGRGSDSEAAHLKNDKDRPSGL
jgi:hypothetical protein